MNQAQFLSNVRDALKIGGAYLIAHGYNAAGTLLTAQDFIGLVLALVGFAWSRLIHADESTPPPPATRNFPILAGICAASLCFTGCKSAKLESGGAYAPVTITAGVTNAATNPEIALYYADAAHKLAYDAVAGVFKFEMEHRAELKKISPQIQHELDRLRPQAWLLERRFALARHAYRAAPSAAGLSELQLIISELGRLVPVAQSQIAVTLNH